MKKRKFEMNLSPGLGEVQNMTFKDLRRACVVRGMEFEKVLGGTFPTLNNWFLHHYQEPIKTELLDQYDDYVDDLCRTRKSTDTKFLTHHSLRLGYVGETDKDGKVLTTKKIKGLPKRKKVKRERTKEGIFSGTKKAYTYDLAKQGVSKEKTIAKVMEKFPEAQVKSINIWYNKALKALNTKK